MDKEKTIKDTISIKPSQIQKAKKIGQKIGKTYKGKVVLVELLVT